MSLAIWPASCSSQLIKVGVVKQLTTNNLTRERTVVYQLFLFPLDGELSAGSCFLRPDTDESDRTGMKHKW